jgi:OmpA family
MKSVIATGFAAVLLGSLALGASAAPHVKSPDRLPVYFAMNEAALTPEAKAVVDEAAKTIQRQSAKTIIVVGASETSGARLNAERATAIEDELVASGVDPDRISLTTGELTASTGSASVPFAGRSAEIIIEPANGSIGL